MKHPWSVYSKIEKSQICVRSVCTGQKIIQKQIHVLLKREFEADPEESQKIEHDTRGKTE